MKLQVYRFLVLCAAGLLLPVLVGCPGSFRGKSTLTTRGGGREVKAVIDGPGSISGIQDETIVKFEGRTLTVEKERVLLDGTELGKVPAAAAKVLIEVQGGELKITADGAAIFSGPLPR